MKFNDKGKQVTFLCRECGKEYGLDDLRYFETFRVCVHCLDKFWEKQKDEARKLTFRDPDVFKQD